MVNKKSSQGITAPKLRLILIATIVLLIIAGGFGFVFAREQLIKRAADVAVATASEKESKKNKDALRSIEAKLKDNHDEVKRTSEIVAPLENFEYQVRIIKDVQAYAAKAGVTIRGFSFTSDTSAASSASGTTSGSAAAASGTAATSPAISGLKKVTTTVELESPIAYKNVMNFLYYLENNLTKMQLQGVSLTRDPAKSEITAGALNLEVYVKQ